MTNLVYVEISVQTTLPYVLHNDDLGAARCQNTSYLDDVVMVQSFHQTNLENKHTVIDIAIHLKATLM